MKNKKIFYGISIAVIVVLFAAICVYMLFENLNGTTNNADKMVSRAMELYEKGDKETAFYQLQVYCDEKPDNYDGYLLMGDWYSKDNNIKKAEECYKKAAKNKPVAENEVSEGKKNNNLKLSSNRFSLKISPSVGYTKNMTLTFSGGDLTPEKSEDGKINGKFEALVNDSNCKTTDWFSVDSSKKYLLLTGNINCAIWQFVNSSGDYTSYTDKSDFRKLDTVRFDNKAYSVVDIPGNAVKARVTYYDKSIEGTLDSNDSIFITYGKTLGGYVNTDKVSFKLPDLKNNQYITYNDGKWLLFTGEKSEKLDLDKLNVPQNAFISIDGDLCGIVSIEYDEEGKADEKVDKSLQYGARYSRKSGVAACERLGAAKGLSFNYTIGNEWALDGENGFDKAYPWCDMKLCNVSVNKNGSKKVTYQGEESFKSDGSNGNVMVQIPKFYTRRNVSENYEEIWISGKKYDGYQVDPIFVGKNGEELSYIYISAYLGAEKDNKIVSIENSYPTLMLKYGDTMRMAENNGQGFSEMNYLMCSALQKLFVVETGTIDSSSVFAGDTFKYYYYDTENVEKSGLAAKDAENTNTITLYDNYSTQKIARGSSIAIFSGWKTYTNNSVEHREVVSIRKNDDYIEVDFDGDPVNIKKHKTTISNVPEKTGKTNDIDYCTGTLEGEDGLVSFKYRNIENLYGSALIMLDDDAYVEDNYFYYYDGEGNLREVSQPVASQGTDLSSYSSANLECCVKQMTYDPENPLVMMPAVVGGGSSSFNYFGDFWTYKSTDNGTKKYLLYGGADDNSRLAGIFHMRAAVLSENFAFSFYSARIMCK